MSSKIKLYFTERLPKVSDIVKITYPVIENNKHIDFMFEAMVIGRSPFHGLEALKNSLSADQVIGVSEAVIELSFAPSRFEKHLLYTKTGTRMHFKDSDGMTLVQVEIIS